jgi:hypothetical protein
MMSASSATDMSAQNTSQYQAPGSLGNMGQNTDREVMANSVTVRASLTNGAQHANTANASQFVSMAWGVALVYWVCWAAVRYLP